MRVRLCLLYLTLAALGIFGAVQSRVQASPSPESCSYSDFFCPATKADSLTRTLQTFPDPMMPPPGSTQAATDFAVSKPISRTVSYTIQTKGSLQTSEQDFADRVKAILDDPRGWSRLGVRFQQVADGGNFTIVLAQASAVPSFGPPCDTEFNCRVGKFVVVNETRWLQGTIPWNNSGGSLPNYQHLIINHELGHWLGHDHPPCPAAAEAAPVMMQQSLDLGGCNFNAWPRDDELWSSRLGI